MMNESIPYTPKEKGFVSGLKNGWWLQKEEGRRIEAKERE